MKAKAEGKLHSKEGKHEKKEVVNLGPNLIISNFI